MVFILSDLREYSTDKVIDWLIYYNISFIRVSKYGEIKSLKLSISDSKTKNDEFKAEFIINNLKINVDFNSIKSFWFRRSEIGFVPVHNVLFKNQSSLILNYLSKEQGALKKFINLRLNEIRHINTRNDVYTNKLYNLMLAKKAGLSVPKSLITNSKIELFEFYNSCKQNIIYKSLDTGYMKDLSLNVEINLPTQLVELIDFENNSNYFFSTYFQENIEKKYEIRAFYLNRNIYATAIFSQNDEMTKQDFRNYNFKKPNRTPIIKLPKHILNSITVFMDSVSLNCGSLDLIFTKDNKFIFLEVNPVGQYEQVSRVTNFYLDKTIADFLINEN